MRWADRHKKLSSWNPGWMSKNWEKTRTSQRQLLCLGERRGKEMNVQLYISCDSVTKINFSKTLQKLRQQKPDSLITASLSFLKKRSSQNAPDLEHVRRTGMKQSLLSQSYKQATFDGFSMLRDRKRGCCPCPKAVMEPAGRLGVPSLCPRSRFAL